MFVRWKTTPRAKKQHLDYRGGDSLTATLVQSEHRDGKPRQKIITYLGSIRQGKERYYWFQNDFWESVTKNLDALTLSPDQRSSIEAAIADRVPRPDPAGREKAARELEDLENGKKP